MTQPFLDLPPEAAVSSSTGLPTNTLAEGVLTASQPFVGRWNKLVSTTNWEKGRIISQWREALFAGKSEPSEYSDQAWSQLVGGVTGQHVGRLRRVYERFGKAQEKFAGLYWSHFQSALDWDDAEMWLEGAVQSGWSVAQMREQRWETMGRVEADRPRDGDALAAETDEDFAGGEGDPSHRRNEPPTAITGKYEEVQGPRHEGPDFGNEMGDAASVGPRADVADAASVGSECEPAAELVRPFENLPELPDDLADAFDAFKLAILHHKADGWRRISCTDVLRSLDALKALALAPADETAPF